VAQCSGRSTPSFRRPRRNTARFAPPARAGPLVQVARVLSTASTAPAQHDGGGDQGIDMHPISRPLIELTGSGACADAR